MPDNIDRYAVFGNPIAHSKSPDIHRQFAEQSKQRLSYTAEHIELDAFEKSVRDFPKQNGKGLNITVPFKQQAWSIADQLSEQAERAGAVNTLIFSEQGTITGDTTDGIGLVRDLVENHKIEISNKRVLIIGAGGAVRGVIEPMLQQSPSILLIANRTTEKAIQLEKDFSDLGNIKGCGLDQLNSDCFDIVINGTSASLQGDLPPLPDTLFCDNACAYDMMYSADPTVFMDWSKQRGAKHVFDGLGMLVEQAAKSFQLWRNVKPDTAPVIKNLRASLQHQQ